MTPKEKIESQVKRDYHIDHARYALNSAQTELERPQCNLSEAQTLALIGIGNALTALALAITHSVKDVDK